jgi:hypothetical protein
MGMMNRVARFARSPQGRRLFNQAMRYAQSPEGRSKIDRVRRQLADRRKTRERVR